MSVYQYEIVDGWFSIEMKELAPLLPLPPLPPQAANAAANGGLKETPPQAANGGLKETPPQAANGGLKETPPAAANGGLKETPQKPYEFDESKLIELDPIDDAFLLETDKDIVKILNDLF